MRFGQSACGRFLDYVGIRRGLSITVAFYSVAAMLTSFAVGLKSLCAFRFLLGAGESANWPGATKAVAEWFPRKESGWAVALFDSGSAVGGAIAPVLVYQIYRYWGDWRPAFLVTGLLGLLWIPLFRWLYRSTGGTSALIEGRTGIHSERPRRYFGNRLARGGSVPHAAEDPADMGDRRCQVAH